MTHTVTKIIDGDTFEVYPDWTWNGHEGSVVRPRGYDAPERYEAGYQAAKDKLSNLILDKEVELKNLVGLTYERLLCDVYYEGKSLAEYFVVS